ncbi:hypothetical protein CkaCkLH20_00443 [Colletotrichum karsti]|uniref:Zn(2)-C6 fungal-type domain-containing protein n=1 Tax=Colletotrichum karsti TaxID=1095194 RepID=A0A9P6LRC5_9PEZI|nr:uncharacterized protein CkaCkLH20_00443 [Colletotrichum karsti]KAF9882407.1 hypothetical protein CkaCkLH20_00443 [Colletotrichum karsti]
MPAINTIVARDAVHQLAKRQNWAAQEAGVVVVFCIVFVVACGLIGLWVSRCIAARKAKRAAVNRNKIRQRREITYTNYSSFLIIFSTPNDTGYLIMYDPPSPLRRLRACEPCTKAKARCNFRDENSSRHLCDRCERLGIDCAAKKTKVVRRPRQIKKPLVNRIASLEQQIASLVTTDKATSSSSSASGHEDDRRHYAVNNHFSSAPPFGLSWRQAGYILDDFRNLFTPNFPFVVVDRKTTARDLLDEKPFLFRAIMLVAAPLPRSRAAEIRDEVLAYLGRRMLLEDEESLDILQGIMIIIMWADIKYFYDKQITRLVYLALGYAHTLNITRIPLSVLATRDAAAPKQPDDCFSDKLLAGMTTHHTLEEQRAFLGLFYVVTVNSSHFARRNPLLQQQQQAAGFSPGLYVDVCCESLERSGDAGDAMAARMARLAHISGRVSEIFGSFANRATGESYSGLCEAQATAIRREMDAIAGEVDPRDSSSTYVWMQYNALVVQLYETATIGGTSTPLYRTTCLLDCLAAARAFYAAFVSMPPERFLYRTSATICQAQAVVTATTRLLVLEAEGWDLESARASLDFLDIAEQIAGLSRRTVQAGRERMRRFFEETEGGRGGGGGDADLDETDSRGGSCEELVEKMGWIGDWYRIKLDADVDAGKALAEGVSRELLDEIARIWQWSPDTGGVPFFGGLLNPFDVSYEGI